MEGVRERGEEREGIVVDSGLGGRVKRGRVVERRERV